MGSRILQHKLTVLLCAREGASFSGIAKAKFSLILDWFRSTFEIFAPWYANNANPADTEIEEIEDGS
jgi:hypothetical protein